jgi:nucleoside-diphosphate-sugar epimerase
VNAYERSKYEAERLVRAHSQVLPIAVVRPSIVISTLAPASRSALPLTLDLVSRGLLPVLPGAPTNTLDVIPADDAAAAIARIVLARGALGTFHVASGDRAPRVTDVFRVGAHRPVRFVDRAHFPSEAAQLPSYDGIAPVIAALAYPKTFDTARAEAVLAGHPCRGNPLDALVPSSPLTRRARVSGRLPAG